MVPKKTLYREFTVFPIKIFRNYKKPKIFAAQVIFKKTTHYHITPLLVELHWMPVKARIDYKLTVLTFK